MQNQQYHQIVRYLLKASQKCFRHNFPSTTRKDINKTNIHLNRLIMTGACDEHKSRKKGACIYCNESRFCEPLEPCSNKANHINWKRNAMRGGTYIAQQVTPATKRLKNIGMQRKTSMRGNVNRPHYSSIRTKKTK